MPDLTVKYSKTMTTTGLHAWLLVAEVTNSVDMPAEVFVMQRGVPSVQGGLIPGVLDNNDCFNRVASIVDIEQFPPNSPDPAAGAEFYRIKKIELIFTDLDLLGSTLELLQQGAQKLVDEHVQIAHLEEIDTVTYSAAPEVVV